MNFRTSLLADSILQLLKRETSGQGKHLHNLTLFITTPPRHEPLPACILLQADHTWRCLHWRAPTEQLRLSLTRQRQLVWGWSGCSFASYQLLCTAITTRRAPFQRIIGLLVPTLALNKPGLLFLHSTAAYQVDMPGIAALILFNVYN